MYIAEPHQVFCRKAEDDVDIDEITIMVERWEQIASLIEDEFAPPTRIIASCLLCGEEELALNLAEPTFVKCENCKSIFTPEDLHHAANPWREFLTDINKVPKSVDE